MTRAQQIGVVIGLVVVAALTWLRANDPEPLKIAREATFDQYQRWAPRAFEPMPVRVVDIDEASLRQFGQWPWPRDRLAALVDALAQMGASSIAFDILFAEPDRLSPRNVVRNVAGIDPGLLRQLPDNDELFAGSIVGNPVVLGFGLSNQGTHKPQVKAGFAFTGESPLAAPPHMRAATPLRPQLEANAAGIGHISLNPRKSSAVVRSVPLLVSDGEQLYPSLALEALRVAQGASTYLVLGAPNTPGTITAVKIGDFVVPTTAAGELWLYVSRDRAERYVSASDILAPGGPSAAVKAAIEDSIVFIGTSAAGLQDIRTTALGQNVPGVSLHAQIVEQILSGRFLSRPDWADGLEILSVAILSGLLVVLTIFVSPAIALAAGLLLTVCALVASWLAFSVEGLLFDPLAPLAAGTVTHFAATSFRFLVTDRERREIRRAFGQYLSPTLLYRIEHTRNALRLGGDDRELTVMFVDVRNFTTMSERLSPTALVGFLNTLLDALSRHVIANEGTLDKFIGDSIMAFWNAPLDVPDHCAKAVRAALAMRETLAELNARDAFGFGPEHKIAIGIGIHTGLACVGNMGAETRFNYSAVGDTVNVTARIESACKEVGFDILVSADAAKALTGHALLDAGALALRGKSDRTNVCAVIGDGQVAAFQEFAELQAIHARLVEALRSRSAASRKLASAAKFTAARLPVQLHEFYDRIWRRSGHFTMDEAGNGQLRQATDPGGSEMTSF
ncbi:adenylate/guanylate cyclase domain-containing protein [Pseudaminobacter arsenicus]|uniref:Adenylate/guanylate cyclase domain-containing protein n=1 Tax=Borborobacter arsenicus TaxID=1851146 RepID=A0A432V2H6_9HYPH|nr:adenylate/guanylate cyclase domain-containing protein [Pseudaminobacter arsenicus]RUM96325.1 adenylate/guanylate cyclase domain-containing protein [Pseudaminobacter arsenicus]